jgi:hypothetical protein
LTSLWFSLILLASIKNLENADWKVRDQRRLFSMKMKTLLALQLRVIFGLAGKSGALGLPTNVSVQPMSAGKVACNDARKIQILTFNVGVFDRA